MGISSELSSIKTNVSDKIVDNKVSRFAYTEQAYTDNEADGVTAYDVNAEQNIPVGTASVMKVNQTVIEKGWRARASSITRMLMNHFLGRTSYNLNKANDLINAILNLFVTYIGSPDGLASLDSSGKVPVTQINKSDTGIANGANSFTSKGAYDYSLGSVTAGSWLGKVFGHLLGNVWKLITPGVTFYTPVYANGLWVAGSNSNGMWWSEDGKAWTQGTGGSNGMNKPVYANGLWVAGSNSNGMWWSEDGKAWTQGTGGTSFSMYSPVYADGLWVAGSNNGMWWSANGKSWTQGTGIDTEYNVYTPCHAQGLWVAGGSAGLFKSADGKAWSAIASVSGISMDSPHYAEGLWIAGSHASSAVPPVIHGFFWSEDGNTWTEERGEDDFINAPASPVYANGVWIASAHSILTTVSHKLYRSTDGKKWTEQSFNVTQVQANPNYVNGAWTVGCSGGFLYSDTQMLMESGRLTD